MSSVKSPQRQNAVAALAELECLDEATLRQRWTDCYGHPPPARLSRALLLRVVAYHQQSKILGGLNGHLRRRLATLALDESANNSSATPSITNLTPGTQLVCDWQGQAHRVQVIEKRFRIPRQYLPFSVTHCSTDIPAQQIEQLILLAISNLLTTPAKLMEFCGALLQNKPHLDLVLARAKRYGEQLPQLPTTEQRIVLLQVIHTVAVDPSQVAIHLSIDGIQQLIMGDAESTQDKTANPSREHTCAGPLIIPWQIRRRGVEMKLIIPDALQGSQRNLDKALIKAIAKGHLWMEQITSGQVKTLAEIAGKNNIKGRWVSRLINLSCLSPDIVERIMDGTQPPHLTLQKLLVHEQIPADWQAQRELFLA